MFHTNTKYLASSFIFQKLGIKLNLEQHDRCSVCHSLPTHLAKSVGKMKKANIKRVIKRHIRRKRNQNSFIKTLASLVTPYTKLITRNTQTLEFYYTPNAIAD